MYCFTGISSYFTLNVYSDFIKYDWLFIINCELNFLFRSRKKKQGNFYESDRPRESL